MNPVGRLGRFWEGEGARSRRSHRTRLPQRAAVTPTSAAKRHKKGLPTCLPPILAGALHRGAQWLRTPPRARVAVQQKLACACRGILRYSDKSESDRFWGGKRRWSGRQKNSYIRSVGVTPFPADDCLPFFSCKAVGDVLLEAARAHPACQTLVLCGHTHGGGELQVLDNLRVVTGPAEYGRPEIQRIIDVA